MKGDLRLGLVLTIKLFPRMMEGSHRFLLRLIVRGSVTGLIGPGAGFKFAFGAMVVVARVLVVYL